jgi:hypothetical protein
MAISEHQLLLLLPLNWHRMYMLLTGAESEITFFPYSDWRIKGRTENRDHRGRKVVGIGWVRLLMKYG